MPTSGSRCAAPDRCADGHGRANLHLLRHVVRNALHALTDSPAGVNQGGVPQRSGLIEASSRASAEVSRMSDDVALLVPFSEYEENAVNIGTQQKSADMARFIQTVRDDGSTSSTWPPPTSASASSLNSSAATNPAASWSSLHDSTVSAPRVSLLRPLEPTPPWVASSLDQPRGPSLLRRAGHALCDRPCC